MENKKESKTYAVIGILTFVFIMSLFILLGQKARAQEVGSGIPKLHGLTGSSPAALSAQAMGKTKIFPTNPIRKRCKSRYIMYRKIIISPSYAVPAMLTAQPI